MRGRSSSELRVTWDPPAGDPGTITQYIIDYRLYDLDECGPRDDHPMQNAGAVTGTTEEKIIGGLKANSAYDVYVAAKNNEGQGEFESARGDTRTGGK